MKYKIVYETLKKMCLKEFDKTGTIKGFSAKEIASKLNMQRSNVARELTKLYKEGIIDKNKGRPVLYFIKYKNSSKNINIFNEDISIFDSIIGKDSSLKHQISLAKAAIVYPPRGLHTLIVGETGVGKSFFAKSMFKYALEVNVIKDNKKFVVFNCADYANNPQLLVSHLLGVKKGTYTGANEDRNGIIEKARDGILFLDEVHRLPPEGQEMLFRLIDEGKYTPLGETKEISINVMIICATTENIDSTLLKTFTRRIPVTISLPSLKERTIEERLSLIKSFFEEESNRISKKIEVSEETLIALLNYDCPNNIGELKSLIQIASAKAFLRSMFKDDVVKVKIDDFSNEVRAELLASKKVKGKNLKLIIKANDSLKEEDIEDKYNLSKNIYEFIENRTESLKNKGLNEDEIKNKVSNEVEKFIGNYLESICDYEKEDDIKRIVNNDLYNFLNNFMYLAEYKLNRKITKNTFLGLLIHIDTFLGRLKENRIIENPRIDEIRKEYPDEFKLAMNLAEKIEEKYGIIVPIDEIGFITMFFAVDTKEPNGKVAVLVAMHGNSTATSIVEVTNQLLNTNHAVGFDMPLSMKPENALNKIENLVKQINQGEGVILLVDMGSLKFFDKIIKNDTGIEVRAVDMVTTATVIEATRKALMNASLDEIVRSVDLESRFLGNFLDENIKTKKDVIITVCSTGEGTAQKLKDMIYSKFSKNRYEVINLSIKNKEEFKITVENIKKERNIVYIISAFDLKIPGIDYISMDKFFKEFACESLEDNKKYETFLKNIKVVYKDYLNIPEYNFIADTLLRLILKVKHKFNIPIDMGKMQGLFMHIGCLIEKLIIREERDKCKNLSIILARYQDIFNYIEKDLSSIEEKLSINFSKDDIGNIVEIIINL